MNEIPSKIKLFYETIKDIIDDILICIKLNVDVASFSSIILSPTTTAVESMLRDGRKIEQIAGTY